MSSFNSYIYSHSTWRRDPCGHDRMVVGFTTTCAISAYNHLSSEFEHRSWRGVLDTLCDKICQWFATGLWLSSGFDHQWNWPPRNNWNIVESGVKHQNHNTPLWKPRRTIKVKILIPFHKTMVIYEFIQPSIEKSWLWVYNLWINDHICIPEDLLGLP